ncbi:MAG: HD domain-containing protein [Desulfohalobiaceae bacterium]|nr:HD domain-containing protein [Desulfohalobiaceae bacterium]
MIQPLKDAHAVCNTINRAGFDAYIINKLQQHRVLKHARIQEVDVAVEADFDELLKIFQKLAPSEEEGILGLVEEGETRVRLYPGNPEAIAHPDNALIRLTPGLRKELEKQGEFVEDLGLSYRFQTKETYQGFADWEEGQVRFQGEPDPALRGNYLLGLRALRFAANFNIPIEANSWMAIVRNAEAILNFVPVSDIVDEWRKIVAENSWCFVRLLFDCGILQGLMPEVSALISVKQLREENGQEESVFEHTVQTMRYYGEQLPYDWFGIMACLLHDVGKLQTAQYVDGEWSFEQHHVVGAHLARRILRRLGFDPEDIGLICHLVKNHKRFDFMLSEKGIRRFKGLDEYPRIIEIARANVQAKGGNYRAFNHNIKYLERADVPEEMTEPVLNGNEIMDFTGLKPGPVVGVIRKALMQAQIDGRVVSVPEAIEFVRWYKARHGL